jgi:hypothetical protein
VVAACNLYKSGRSHLAEYLTKPIFEGHLLGSDDAPEEYGLLKEGQYTEEYNEYWWINVTELTDIAGVHRQNTRSTTEMVQPVFYST